MIKKVMEALRKWFKKEKKENWAEKQIKEMAKLGGKLVL